MITASEINKFASCQRAWWYRYVLGISKKKTTDAMFVGNVFHEAIYNVLTGKSNDELLEKVNIWAAIGDYRLKTEALARAYITTLPSMVINVVDQLKNANIISCESVFKKEFNGETVAGVYDVLTDSCVIDFKTTGRPELYTSDAVFFSTAQAMIYGWASRVPVIFVVIKTPTFRIKKNESEVEFIGRIIDYFTEPGSIEVTEPIKSNKEHTEAMLNSFIKQRSFINENKLAPIPALSSCSSCAYKSLCAALRNGIEEYTAALTAYEKKDPYTEIRKVGIA